MRTLLEKSLRTFTDHPPILTLTYFFVYVMPSLIENKFNSIQFNILPNKETPYFLRLSPPLNSTPFPGKKELMTNINRYKKSH